MDISRRKMMILQKIVSLYTLSGDPVGSKILSQFIDEFSLSSATLRNEMAELTGLGLLEQPHTSAGRVPTTLGYRYYVDHLVSLKDLTKKEKEFIDQAVGAMDADPDSAAEEAAKTLADLTGLAALATTPGGGNIQITYYYIVPAGRFNLAVIGITGIGGVKSRVCRVEEELDEAAIKQAMDALNKYLVFVSSADVDDSLLEAVNMELSPNDSLFAPIVTAAVAIIRNAEEVRVFTGGQQHLLSFPELDSHIKELLELFSDDSAIQQLDTNEPLKVFVGDEPGSLGIDSLGIVMGRYRAAGGRHGALAVAGPVRMDYGFVIPRLIYFRDRVSASLTSPGV